MRVDIHFSFSSRRTQVQVWVGFRRKWSMRMTKRNSSRIILNSFTINFEVNSLQELQCFLALKLRVPILPWFNPVLIVIYLFNWICQAYLLSSSAPVSESLVRRFDFGPDRIFLTNLFPEWLAFFVSFLLSWGDYHRCFSSLYKINNNKMETLIRWGM